jgi:23S rRNA pseudouridine2605 synthase
MEDQRIQKVLSAAGVASRRDVEEMILHGRITVNGELVTKLPCFVGLGDEILVDGRTVRKRPRPASYYLLNKPRGVICTQRDEPKYDRPRAVDLLGRAGRGLHCVGRLDENSTGLIILTDDGALTNRLTHPRYGVTKIYVARVTGRVTAETVAAMEQGIYLDGKRTAGVKVKVLRKSTQGSLVEIRLREGRNRQVRRMLARLGHKVRRLHRRAIGPLTDRGLKIGNFRRLSAEEAASLSKAAGADKP